jgi:hypothetical protein
MLKLIGIVALVALILVGALMPLKYTARMKLPNATTPGKGAEPDRSGDSAGD